jgi:hypothetical protein
MDALVSGRLGLAVLLDRTHLGVISAASPFEPRPLAPAAATAVYRDVGDSRVFEAVELSTVSRLLLDSVAVAEGLELLVVALDAGYPREVRALACENIEDRLRDPNVADAIASVHIAIMSSSPRGGRLEEVCPPQCTKLRPIAALLSSATQDIELVKSAWDALPDSIFEGSARCSRRAVWRELLYQGVLYRLVRARHLAEAVSASDVSHLDAQVDASVFAEAVGRLIERLRDGRASASTGEGSVRPRQYQQVAEEQALSESGQAWGAGTRHSDEYGIAGLGAASRYHAALRRFSEGGFKLLYRWVLLQGASLALHSRDASSDSLLALQDEVLSPLLLVEQDPKDAYFHLVRALACAGRQRLSPEDILSVAAAVRTAERAEVVRALEVLWTQSLLRLGSYAWSLLTLRDATSFFLDSTDTLVLGAGTAQPVLLDKISNAAEIDVLVSIEGSHQAETLPWVDLELIDSLQAV